jgi:hypothetical protein
MDRTYRPTRRYARPPDSAATEFTIGTHANGPPHDRSDSGAEHGLDPAPERNQKTTWKEFLSRHGGQIVATDFFPVAVWTPRGLQRFLALCFTDLSTRKVEIVGIAQAANGLWMTRFLLNVEALPARRDTTNSSTPHSCNMRTRRTVRRQGQVGSS